TPDPCSAALHGRVLTAATNSDAIESEAVTTAIIVSEVKFRSDLSRSEVMTMFLAFLIGVIAGLRSLTAPAVVAWAAHRNWLNLYSSPLSFMGSTAAIIVFTLLALVELVADQLPSAPRRTEPPGLIARMLLGGL